MISKLGRVFNLALARRILWLTDDARDLNGAISARSGLLLIVGREHYEELRRQYPVRSQRELKRVVRHELVALGCHMGLMGPQTEKGHEVIFYRLRDRAIREAHRSIWMIPESRIVALSLPRNSIAAIERGQLRYFVSADSVSLPVGGVVSSIQRFALAVGRSDWAKVVELDARGLRQSIELGLRQLRAADWLAFFKPLMHEKLEINWRPVLNIGLAAVSFYMVIASAYLWVTQGGRERQLAALGSDVESLLQSQDRMTLLSVQQAELAKLINGKTYSYEVWEVVSSAWRKGALIDDISLSGNQMSLRGAAPVATEILAEIRANSHVADVRFTAPVRTAPGGGESFAISLRLKRQAEGG